MTCYNTVRGAWLQPPGIINACTKPKHLLVTEQSLGNAYHQSQCVEFDIIVISDDSSAMHYPGGKGKCFQQLINIMPLHEVYIETHLGGGSVLRHKKPAKYNVGIDIDPSVIECWDSKKVKDAEFVCGDAVSYISSFQFTGRELIYCDPPYLPHTRRRSRVYRHDYGPEDHVQLLQTLKNTPCMIMLSGYDSDLYNDMLNTWRKISFEAKTHVGTRTECVWMNFPPPSKLHDTRYMGGTFRERQTIKRRHDRLRARISNMPAVERHALFEWLKESYGQGQ